MTTNINKKAFSLVELALVSLLAVIVLFGIMIIIIDSHRGWGRLYERVNGKVFSDSVSAKRAFDAVVRKASYKQPAGTLTELSDVTLYYYNDPLTSLYRDRYARFYFDASSNELLVEYGVFDQNENKNPSTTLTLAENVDTSLSNFSTLGSSIRMTLVIDDGVISATVTSSAYRHNP